MPKPVEIPVGSVAPGSESQKAYRRYLGKIKPLPAYRFHGSPFSINQYSTPVLNLLEANCFELSDPAGKRIDPGRKWRSNIQNS